MLDRKRLQISIPSVWKALGALNHRLDDLKFKSASSEAETLQGHEKAENQIWKRWDIDHASGPIEMQFLENRAIHHFQEKRMPTYGLASSCIVSVIEIWSLSTWTTPTANAPSPTQEFPSLGWQNDADSNVWRVNLTWLKIYVNNSRDDVRSKLRWNSLRLWSGPCGRRRSLRSSRS